MKKRIAMLMIALLIPATLIGCKPKVDADQSAKILTSFIVKNDTSEISKLGGTDSSLYESTNAQKITFKKEFKIEAKKSLGITLDDSTADKLYNSYSKALKKDIITTSKVSENGQTAEVKVKVNYIDVKEIVLNAVSDTLDKNINSESELSNTSEISKKYLDNIIEQLDKAKPSTKSTEKTFKFVVKDNVWIPENKHAYVDGVMDLAQGSLLDGFSKLKMSPDKSAAMWFDFFVKTDNSGSDKALINFLGKDFAEKLDNMKEKAFTKGIKISSSDFTISDDDCHKIYSAYKNAIKNTTVSTKTISKASNTALVSVTTNYIDVKEISKKAASEAITDVRAMNLTDETQAQNEVIKSFITHLENDLNTVTPKVETKERTFDFASFGGTWVPANGYEFGNEIQTMVAGE